jgi:hypothetical protein
MLSRSAWNRPYRPYRRRRRGIVGTAVFGILLLLTSIEAAWCLQPLWRSVLHPPVVLAESSPPREPATRLETSALFLQRADDALALGHWSDASTAFDRAAELDAVPPSAALASARKLLEIHRIDESLRAPGWR